MKKYDRQTKSWVEEEEFERKNSKRKQCKGSREHDWILCLPSYVTVQGSELGLEKVEEYYQIEDEREDANIAFDERLEAIGIKSRRWHGVLGRRRSYICSVCLKRK
jgi:hypothetical protein